MKILELLKSLTDAVNTSDAGLLENAVRTALIRYHLRISNIRVVELTGQNPGGNLNLKSPVQFHGKGKIRISPSVVFGVIGSPGNLSYSYIAALDEKSAITFGENVALNNRACIVSNGASIRIGDNCLIGPDVIINDSNGHELAVSKRLQPDSQPKSVVIGNDVFIGSRTTILKGVTIGDGCVIAAGSVLYPGFTADNNTVIGGNPAQVLKQVPL